MKIVQNIPKIIGHDYIYQLTKFGDLMSCGSKIYLQMHLVSCTNTHHDVIGLVNHGMVEGCVRYTFACLFLSLNESPC